MAIDWKELKLEDVDTDQQSIDEPPAIEETTHLAVKHYEDQYGFHNFS